MDDVGLHDTVTSVGDVEGGGHVQDGPHLIVTSWPDEPWEKIV